MNNILRLKKVLNEDLTNVIAKSKIDYSTWVIVEGDNRKYKFHFIEAGYYEISIENVANDTLDTITECYRKAKILQSLYFTIHITYEELNKMVPSGMLNDSYKIKDSCKKICHLDFYISTTENINPFTVFYCESESLNSKEESLSEILKEFGNYTITSSQKLIIKDNMFAGEFITDLPYNLYRFVLCL